MFEPAGDIIPYLGKAALDYLADGLAVIPFKLTPGGDKVAKRPLVAWLQFQRRLPTPREVEEWFTALRPNAVGLILGPATWAAWPGLWVLDVEASHRREGERLLDARLGAGWRERTWWAESISGGIHVYFTAWREVRSARWDGGEVRGEGSLVVLPPSGLPDGRCYRWGRFEADPTPLDPADLDLPGLRDRRLYRVLAERPLVEGERNLTLTSLAGLARRAGLEPADIGELLRAVNARRCEPPLPEAEIERIARSAAGWEPGAQVQIQRNNGPVGTELRALTPAEILTTAPRATTESLPLLGYPGYIIKGWSHVLAGPPKVGKTELLYACTLAWARAGLKIHWLSEEPNDIWAARLRRWGWADGLLVTPALGAEPEALLAHARSVEADVLIVDTLRNLMQIDEVDNQAIARTLAAWEAALAGRTRIYVHHTRKGGGLHGEAVAGGFGFVAAVARVLELGYDPQVANRRRLKVYSRIETPPDLVYELSESGELAALGDPAALSRAELQRRLLEVLDGEWRTVRELREALDPAPSEELIRQALKVLLEAGEVERDPPDGGRGVVHRWRRAGA